MPANESTGADTQQQNMQWAAQQPQTCIMSATKQAQTHDVDKLCVCVCVCVYVCVFWSTCVRQA